MKKTIKTNSITNTKAARTIKPMTILLLVLLGIVVVSMFVFSALMFRLSLEDADFWLKVLSGTLAVFVLAVGLAALITGHFVNQRQAEKILNLDKDAAGAKEKQAKAESHLAMLSQWRNKKETPRWQFLDGFPEYLRGKRAGVAEMLYVPADDEEPLHLAIRLAEMLSDAGWTIERLEVISEDDPSQLLNPEALKGRPLLARVGGSPSVTVWAKNMPVGRWETFDAPGPALVSALKKCDIEVYGWSADNFRDGFVKIVIGPKR